VKHKPLAMVFDADGVIVTPKTWFVAPAERVHGVPEAEFMAFIRGEFMRCTTGELELLEVLPTYLERWNVRVSTAEFVRQWLEHENAVDQRMLERIQKIRAAGTPCYLGTNQERNRAAYMKFDMGLEVALDGIFASSDFGVRKPDPEFYCRVQNALGLEAQDILFWDDSSANVEAARAVGWQAELFTTVAQFDQQLNARLNVGLT
jgi:HAD superfamily hydrolase (TIGR01509 family)